MTYRHAAHIAWQIIDGEPIILNLEQRQMVGFNRSGGILWKAMGRGTDIDGFRSELRATHGESAVEAVTQFIDKLKELDLIRASDSDQTEDRQLTSIPVPADFEAPSVTWQEPMLECVGQSCGMFPGQTYICNQYPIN